MKKTRTKWLAAVLAAVLLMALAVAVSGDDLGKDDPLISLSFLTGNYEKELTEKVQKEVTTQAEAMAARFEQYDLDAPAPAQSGTPAPTHSKLHLNIGDSQVLAEGGEVLMLSGTVSAASAGLMDVTAGAPVPASGVLTADHLYTASSDVTLMATQNSELLLRK